MRLSAAKVKEYGFKWLVRRIVREMIRPSTTVGQYLQPFSQFSYYCISKPTNFIFTRIKKMSFKEDTLYFFYDFEIEPITYDFVWALCVANTKRQELGLAYLQVVFVPGSCAGLRKEIPEYELVLNHDARIWRIYSILLPSIKLLGSLCGVTLCNSRAQASFIREKHAKYVYPPQYNVTFPTAYEPELAVFYRQKVLSLSADNQAKIYIAKWIEEHARNRKVIVVTLRQYAYTPQRNSNIQAWARFAKELDEQEYFIVFIADVEQALHAIPKELEDYTFFNPACWNLNLRCALYEAAYLNMGVNTGPMSLCWFNAACRYITFKAAVKNVPEIPLKMITDKGFIPNTNPLFATNFQKWVWEDDDFEIINEEFKLMCKEISA